MLAAILLLVVKVGIIVSLAALVARGLHQSTAASRHLAWALALAGVLALPVASAFMPAWRIPVRALVSPKAPARAAAVEPSGASRGRFAPRSIELSTPVAPGPTSAPVQLAPAQGAGLLARAGAFLVATQAWWGRLALLAWSLGSLLALVRLGRDIVLARGLVRRGAVSACQGEVDALALDLGLRSAPRLLESAEATVPMTFGALRPVVLVPVGFSSWDLARRREVMLHELAHVTRQDWGASLLARVAKAMFWFHPLVHLAERRLRAEAEQAADDLVLARGTRASSYAAHLLGFVRAAHPVSRSSAMTLSMIGGPLDRRIHAVLDATRRRGPVSFATRLALGAGALAVVLGCSSVEVRAEPAPRGAWNRMAESVHELFDSTPTSGSGWYSRAMRLHHAGRHAEAIECWQKAIAAGHEPETSTYNIACAHAMMGHETQALDALERSIELGFDVSDYLHRDSDLASLRGNARFEALREKHGDRSAVEAPRQELARLEAAASPDADALYQVGTELLLVGDHERAIDALRRSLAADPSSRNASYNLACALALSGREAEALSALGTAVELGYSDADHASEDSDLAALRDEPRFAEILDDMRAVELPGSWFLFGHEMGIDTEAWKEARERHQAYLKRHPGSGHAWSNLGFIQLGLDAPDAAREAYGRAQALGYAPGQTAYNLACALARSGEVDAAFASLERASSLGFEMGAYLSSDDDLDALRDDPRFADLQRRHPSVMHRLHDHFREHLRSVLAL